jgi:general stress protein CsbA
MCFSASASFSASIVLGAIGIATIRKAHHPAQIAFACIPFFFAVQQLIEGGLWLVLANPAYHKWQQLLTYLFLIFAEVIWPFCVPIAIILIEPINKQRKIQKLFIVLGIIVSIYLAYCLLNYPVSASIVSHHIYYQQDFPKNIYLYSGALYLIATIGPALFSKIKYIWWLGATILLSCIITAFFYSQYLISVWCFFSSLISLSVYGILMHLKKTHQAAKELPTIIT